MNEYEHEINEQTTLLLMWIVLHRIDCKSTYLFKKKYLLLTKDQISLFIHWIVYLRDQFSCVGIEDLKVVYNKSISKTCDIQISPELSPLHDDIALPPVDEDFQDEDSIKCNNTIISNTSSDRIAFISDEFLVMPELNVYGEFLFDIDEWDKIRFINLHGRERLNKDWTAVFSDKISKIYPACVLNSIIIGS